MEHISNQRELANLLQGALGQGAEIAREIEKKYPHSRRLLEFLSK